LGGWVFIKKKNEIEIIVYIIIQKSNNFRLQDSMASLSSDNSSDAGAARHSSLHDKIRIVSQQSTSRPGCIIQLDAIADATHVSYQFIFLYLTEAISF